MQAEGDDGVMVWWLCAVRWVDDAASIEADGGDSAALKAENARVSSVAKLPDSCSARNSTLGSHLCLSGAFVRSY